MGILRTALKDAREHKQRKKKMHISAMDLYTGMAYDALTANSFIENEQIGADKVRVGYDRISTDSCTQCFFYISSVPQFIDTSLLQRIREYVETDNVRVNYDINMDPQVIHWESTNMKDMQRSWENLLRDSEEEESNYFEDQRVSDKNDREKWLVKSWRYISEADRHKQALIAMSTVIKLKTIDNSQQSLENLKDACRKVQQYCAQEKIEVKQAKGRMLDFVQYISPLINGENTISRGMIPTRVMTDDIIANMLSFTSGKLNQTEILMGLDVYTNMLTYMDFNEIRKRSLNILIAATTSSGKSTYAKCLTRELLANNKNVIVLDRDKEYNPITKKVDGVIIDLNRSVGKYFDSMRIGDLTGIEEIDIGLLEDSISATTSVFNSLTSIKNGMSTQQRKIFNDAYNLVLAQAGVERHNSSTWSNSAKLKYHDIYREIVLLSRNSGYQERYGDVLYDFVDTLSVFFEPNGLRSNLFKEKVNISDILEAKQKGNPFMLDICLYLDKDMDKSAEGRIEKSIKAITANYLTTLLTNQFAFMGEETIVIVEEYNRYLDSGNDDSVTSELQGLITNMVTGNRKRNAATILVTNNPKEIVTANKQVTMALVDNIKNLIIGKIESQDTINKICSTWNIAFCEKTINDISTNYDFKHTFLLRMESGEIAVVKQLLPPDQVNSPVYSTSD